jgi:hypothetical protein
MPLNALSMARAMSVFELVAAGILLFLIAWGLSGFRARAST